MDNDLKAYFRNIFGVRISHLEPYRIALTHKSASTEDAHFGRINNERLEYLGDAVLGAITADFLYHKYPLESEGILTRMRSKLVNRSRLNDLGRKLGLHDVMKIDNHVVSGAANGNAFEAVVGALYLDKGYAKAYDIIINHIFLTHVDIDAVFEEDKDFKSRILIWAQKNKHKVTFENSALEEEHGHVYKSILLMDKMILSEGLGLSIKKAEQAAAEKAIGLIEKESFE